MSETLLIGSSAAEVKVLADALDAQLLTLPEESPASGWEWAGELEAWRAAERNGPAFSRVVVAVWATSLAPADTIELDAAAWEARAEQAFARWVIALGCAAATCTDGGSIVAVVDGPSPLESPGFAPETAVAEGVRALARSLALSEGARGVRVNTVSTPARLPLGDLLHPAPPLPTFPGTIERDVAGAVRLLLSRDAAGITGGIIFADAGRAWR